MVDYSDGFANLLVHAGNRGEGGVELANHRDEGVELVNHRDGGVELVNHRDGGVELVNHSDELVNRKLAGGSNCQEVAQTLERGTHRASGWK